MDCDCGLSPEFDPGWRVVSEYAHGQFGWLLSLMFLFDAVSVWSLAYGLRSQIQTNAGRAGWMLLIVSGLGTAGAAIFTIDHPLHEPCALTSILGLTMAAMMISVSLGRTTPWSHPRTSGNGRVSAGIRRGNLSRFDNPATYPVRRTEGFEFGRRFRITNDRKARINFAGLN